MQQELFSLTFLLAKFAVGAYLLLELEFTLYYSLFFCLFSACLDLNHFQVFCGDWDFDVVCWGIFSYAVITDEKDVMVFIGIIEDLLVGASC